MLQDGKKLLLIEIDGPRQDSMDYYKQKYGVPDQWIDQNSIEVNKENMSGGIPPIAPPFSSNISDGKGATGEICSPETCR